MASDEHEPPVPPIAERRPHLLESHGRERVDDWYWLRDRDDPAVIAYLEAENAYTAAVLAPTGALQSELFEGIRSRIVETDAGAPSRHGPWWYYSRTVEGFQYPIYCRRPDPSRRLSAADIARINRDGASLAGASLAGASPAGDEVVLLDENTLASGDYLQLGVFDVSPDHRLLAYAADHDGSESYSLRFRDLATGEDLPDTVEGVYYGSAWATDGRTFFYVRPDDAMRPYQVWRHLLGGGAEDALVFEEGDERFFVGVGLSRTETRVVIHSSSSTTSEFRWVDATEPTGGPRVILPREDGVEYDAEHEGSSWLVRTNRPSPDGSPATNFALYRLAEPGGDARHLQVVLPHRPDVTIESTDAFAGHIVVWERHVRDGLARIRVIPRDAGTGQRVTGQRVIEQPEEVYTLFGGSNPEWDVSTYRFGYTSLVTPSSSVDYDVATGGRETVWTQPVKGYDQSAYVTERVWAPASDGERIPVSLIRRAGLADDGPPPLVLYGYGAYETNIDPSFSPSRLNLLERGMSFAIAHVRGGGERGRAWYEGGRLEHKENTFSDFVAVAEHLVASGRADRDNLTIRGGSAGGLLMGAVTNMRPDLWRAVVAEVPFVDVVTTMSDPSLPLTVTEWDEWGDPLHDPSAYERMVAYSPFDNVGSDPYPAMLVTAGLNDPRVGFWEPAKWVAKLRAAGAGGTARPVLLRTEMGAGHGGKSGRYDAWKDEALVQAFVLWQAGLA